MKAKITINGKTSAGSYAKSFLVRLARLGASIVAYPETGAGGESVDMDTDEGFDYIRNYNGR